MRQNEVSEITLTATANDAAATVSGAGTATITVTTQDGGFTDTCTVTVLPKEERASLQTKKNPQVQTEPAKLICPWPFRPT